jgi:endonuclease YncB( thermonuclease family)
MRSGLAICLLVVLAGVAMAQECDLAVELVRVVDGDTLVVSVPDAHPQLAEQRVRLLGVDTPEVRGVSPALKDLAAHATQFTAAFLDDAGSIVLCCEGRDSFGRLLCRVEADGRDLGEALMEAGLALPYGADWESAFGGNASGGTDTAAGE